MARYATQEEIDWAVKWSHRVTIITMVICAVMSSTGFYTMTDPSWPKFMQYGTSVLLGAGSGLILGAGGVLIQKGFSKDAYIQGDIVGNNVSGRTIEFDIDKTSDVFVVGQLYGYGVAPAIGGSAVSSFIRCQVRQ